MTEWSTHMYGHWPLYPHGNKRDRQDEDARHSTPRRSLDRRHHRGVGHTGDNQKKLKVSDD